MFSTAFLLNLLLPRKIKTEKRFLEILILMNKLEQQLRTTLNNILKEGYKHIKSVKCFIEELVANSTLFEMNNFFYENIKCLSLYFLYCIFSEDSHDT